MKKIGEKKGQQSVGMSFGMIFSFILIAVFIVVAFVAINLFLDIGNTVEVRGFYENLQEEINSAWSSQSSSFQYEMNVGGGITTICIANATKPITNRALNKEFQEIGLFTNNENNIFLLPTSKTEGTPTHTLQHLDINKIITEQGNPYCIKEGERITIKKELGEKLVTIEKT
jgi:hypothetical protein